MSKTISAVKARARLLKTHLEKVGKALSLSEALEAVSACENQTDWNRYQSVLKHVRTAPEELNDHAWRQPHKLFYAPPGSGSGAIAEIVFVKNIMNGKIPVLIMVNELNFPANKEADTSGWLTINTKYTNNHETNVWDIRDHSGIKGIIIKLSMDEFPGRNLEMESRAKISGHSILTAENARLTALHFIMRDMLKWPADIKSRLGTITFYGMEGATLPGYNTYSKTLPEFMKNLSREGGTPNLFIVSSSDIMSDDLLKSEDEYKLIIAQYAGNKPFSRCPIEQFFLVSRVDDLKPILGKLFRNEHRMIEDICLYVGTLSTKLIIDDDLNKGEGLAFMQRYMKGVIGSKLIQDIQANISA